MEKYIKKYQELGIVLIIFGVTLGNLLYEFLGKSINLVNMMMLVGVIFIGNYGTLLKFKTAIPQKDTIVMLIFQIILLTYLTIYSNRYVKSAFSDFTYILFALGLIFMLNSNGYNIKINRLLDYLFIFTFFILLGIFIVILKNGFYTRFTFSSGADPLAMGLGITSCLSIILVYNSNNILKKIIKIISIFMLIYCELAFNCRTAIVSCILITILYIIQDIRISENINQKIRIIFKVLIRLVFMFIAFIVIYNEIPVIKNAVDYTIGFIYRGIGALYMDGGYGVDASANTRLYTRVESFNLIYNSNIFQFLFGYGYMKMYVDIPILQAFLDMGIIGGSIYTYIIFIIPLKIIFSKQYINHACNNYEYRQKYLLFTLLTITVMVRQFGSALPYGHDVYWPTILCLFMTKINTKKITIDNKESAS